MKLKAIGLIKFIFAAILAIFAIEIVSAADSTLPRRSTAKAGAKKC